MIEGCQKMIRQKKIITNTSSGAILRNTFASVQLKDIIGLLVKLHLTSFKVTFFID